MASSTSAVATMAQQIERIVEKPSWQNDGKVKDDLMKVLGKLTTVRVDVDLLKNTGIGKWVKKLTKYDDEVVKGYSSSLTEKWKVQVGVASEKPTQIPSSANGSRGASRQSSGNGNGNNNGSRASAMASSAGSQQRVESARKNLQERYASERAKREARTVQVINRPITKRRGTTISAAPSRSSVGAARSGMASMSMNPRRSTMGATGRAAPHVAARRPLPPPTTMASQTTRRPATAPSASSGDDARLRKRERLLALAKQARQSEGRSGPSIQRAPMERLPPSDVHRSSRDAVPHRPVDGRKALLDRMIPRVCGVAETSTKQQTKTGGGSGPGSKGSSTAAGATAGSSRGSKKKPVNYTEGQRDVIQWLKGLDVDMSSYAPAFLDNGFDSIKLLNEIKPRDLEFMVPKTGHQRMIEKALSDLKRKHATAASNRPRSAAPRDRDRDAARRKPPHGRHPDSYFDEDSDDSFVVSDGDEYAPGVISAMMRKGRKRSYSIDSTDSYNMEASFAEMQHEEERSKRIGEYEDYREELRNKKILKKTK